MGSIYLALNTITRKCYVGQTQRSTRERKRVHISEAMRGSSTYFHRALRKYGVTSFRWSTLLRDVPNARLDYWEMRMIRKHHTQVPYGYNIRPGGLTIRGWKETEEHRRKISEGNKGKHNGPKTSIWKSKISKTVKALWSNQDYRNQMLTARKNKGPRGESHYKAKLTETDVRKIRHLYSTGEFSQRALADMFGVSQFPIRQIINGYAWAHVTQTGKNPLKDNRIQKVKVPNWL